MCVESAIFALSMQIDAIISEVWQRDQNYYCIVFFCLLRDAERHLLAIAKFLVHNVSLLPAIGYSRRAILY